MKNYYNILNYFNMRALFMGIGISRILKTSQEYFYISILLGTIFGAIFLHYVKVENKKNFLNVVISLLFMSFGLIILVNMVASMYLPQMPKLMVAIPILILLFYALNKEEIIIFRVASIILAVNLITYIFATLSLLPHFELNNFYYTDTDPVNIFIGAFQYMILSVSPTLLTRNKECANYSLVKTYIISSITMCFLCFLTYGLLGPKLVGVFRYPEYIILKNVALADSLENIENIVSFMWIFDVIILLLCCGNNVKNNLNRKWLIYILIPAIILITNYLNNEYTYLIIVYKYGIWIIGGIALIYTLINKKVHHS